MQTYTFTRTMQYTETIEVQAETKNQADLLAFYAEGEHNNDDTFIDLKLVEEKQR